MLPLRYSRWWLVAGVLVLLAVFAAALAPALSWTPKLKSGVGADKWLHTGTFLFLGLWFSGQYARRFYWRIALGLLLFGALIELAQRLTTHRTGDFYDLAADVAGIGLGLMIAAAGVGGWSLRLERWLSPAAAETER